MTFTSGFRASIVSRADSALYWPTRFVLCKICRCRLLSSTTSASIITIVPTPAAAKQFELAALPHFRHQQVAAVAFRLRLAQDAGLDERVAVGLPLAKATRHGNHILVAHLLQSGPGNKGAHAAGAVKNYGLRSIGYGLFYLQLEETTGHVKRTGDMAFVPLVLLAYIYNDDLLIARAGLVLVCQDIMHLRWRPFWHLPPRLAHNLAGCITHVSSPFVMLTKSINLVSKNYYKKITIYVFYLSRNAELRLHQARWSDVSCPLTFC